jgi:transposase
MLEQAWAGVDVGKEHHHCVVIDAEGRRLLSRRVANDEAVLLALISDVTGLAGQVRWAVDISTGEAALLLRDGDWILGRMSRVSWNFDDDRMIVRRRSRCHCGGW